MTDQPMIIVEDLAKTFVLHNAESAIIPVFQGLRLEVGPGECVVLAGESGVGKSTLMRSIYGNYLPTQGGVRVLHDGQYVDITQASPHQVLDVRRRTLGYVSQFLRVIPRVPTLQVVAEPLRALGTDPAQAEARATALLERLNVPRALWSLSPTTFSGGEQQRVNIARGFVHPFPALLLDEPTASLDATNRAVVLDLIHEAKARGAAILGIFHDAAARAAVCDREVDVSAFAPRRDAA